MNSFSLSRALAVAMTLLALPREYAGATQLFEDTIEQKFPLESSDSFSLSAVDGTVQIYGSDTTEVKVVAVRKAFSPARLNGIGIHLEKINETVKVVTTMPLPAKPWADHSGTVDYVINVPQSLRRLEVMLPNGELVIDGLRGAAVSASVGNGRATLRNCFCDQSLRVATGGFDLIWDWAEDRALQIDAGINAGNARALLPSDASFHIQASAPGGKVRSDFTEIKKRERVGVSRIDEQFGSGPASTLRLTAAHGNILISEVIW